MAYNAPYRPSILHRPVKNSAKANVENLDAEFEKGQQRIAARAGRLASTEERLIKSFYGTEVEKRDSWQTTQQELQEHAAARQAAHMQERQREEQWLSQPQQVFVDTRQPWTAQSTTYYMSREEEAEARRRAQREAAEENRYMIQYRSFQQQQERELEREAIQKTMQSEEAWFNLGAANERWVPPERRIKQRAVVAPQFAVGPAPYYCEAEGSGAAVNARVAERPNTAPGRAGNVASEGQAALQTNPRRTAFWERESGQGMKSALNHDVYFQGEQAQPRRRTSHQEGFQAVQVCRPSPVPSTVTSRPGTATPAQRPAQPPPAQPKYPWTWE